MKTNPRTAKIARALLSLLLLMFGVALADGLAKAHGKPAVKKAAEPKEVLIFKNGDQLTGKLLNSTGTKIKFDSDVAGEITVTLDKIKELKSDRPFAIVTKEIKGSRNSEIVAHGLIRLSEKGITVIPLPTGDEKKSVSTSEKEEAKPTEVETLPPHVLQPAPSEAAGVGTVKSATPVTSEARQTIAASSIGFIVDDATYQKELDRKIGWKSGWDGHITTGSTAIRATQNSYLFQIDVALKRSIPTVGWLDPKLRTTVDYTQSAGQTSEVGTVTTITNIFHADAERDEYFNRRGYYLQQTSFDHDSTQGLDLQQIYGAGVGATLFKQENSEFDITADLHYESQAFNSTADVSSLSRHLIGSSLTEAYTRKFGKLRFDEKSLADIAWNNANAFSASATSAARLPIYKKLGFSAAVIDNFQNDPQIGYKKNSFQLSTGFTLSLH